jgi:hypothetical protein
MLVVMVRVGLPTSGSILTFRSRLWHFLLLLLIGYCLIPWLKLPGQLSCLFFRYRAPFEDSVHENDTTLTLETRYGYYAHFTSADGIVVSILYTRLMVRVSHIFKSVRLIL